MFSKILIANRGEIALRVIRACREMGVRTVAIYSDADRSALHVGKAEEAYCVGPAPSAQSYLRADRILDVARQSRADAIHPGYGFLSENPAFAEACEKAGIVFIGPSSETMKLCGSKSPSPPPLPPTPRAPPPPAKTRGGGGRAPRAALPRGGGGAPPRPGNRGGGAEKNPPRRESPPGGG